MSRLVANTIARNTAVLFIQQGITWTSSFLLMMFLPRSLGPVAFGRFFLAFSVAELFRVLVSYGATTLVAKDISRNPENAGETIVNAMAFRAVFATVSIAAMIGFSLIAEYPVETEVLFFVFGLGLLFTSVHFPLYGVFQGLEIVHYNSLGSIAERAFVCLVGISVLLMGGGAVAVAIVFLAGLFLNTSVLLVQVRKFVAWLPSPKWSSVFRQIRDGIPYFLFSASTMIYYRINTLMLSKMAPEEVLGWYGAAMRFFDTLMFFPSVFAIAILPTLSRLWKDEADIHKQAALKSLEFVSFVGIPVSLLVALFSEEIVALLYGAEGFVESATILRILSIGLVFIYVDIIVGTTLLASDKQYQQSVVALCAIPFNVLLNYFLIPYFGELTGNGGSGAAVATVLTEVCVLVAFLSIVPTETFRGFRIMGVCKAAACGVAMCFFLAVLKVLGVSFLIGILPGFAIYGMCLFKAGVFDATEQAWIVETVSFNNLKRLATLMMPSRTIE
jgi:O-antigen/teichoic acid export membrane protein